MEDKRAYLYRYDSSISRWGFVPIPGTDMGNEKASLKPIETWTTSKGEIVTLCDCTYSIVAVKEMMDIVEDPRGVLYPPVSNNTHVVVCLAQEKSKDGGDMVVCIARKPIDSGTARLKLISRNHSQGCEPRYGQASVEWSLDIIKGEIQETAVLSVSSTEIHEKDWKLYM